MIRRQILYFCVTLFLSGPALAAEFQYDLSAGSGRYNNVSYAEITGGLNWNFTDWWTWRNAIFHRFGSDMDSVTGLDTSLRLGNAFATEGGDFGIDFYAGPGLRFANSNGNALFAELGVGFKLAGIYLGVGAKSLYYTQTRLSSLGTDLPKNDTQVYLVLAGGGSF